MLPLDGAHDTSELLIIFSIFVILLTFLRFKEGINKNLDKKFKNKKDYTGLKNENSIKA